MLSTFILEKGEVGIDPYWQGTAIGTIVIAVMLTDRASNRSV